MMAEERATGPRSDAAPTPPLTVVVAAVDVEETIDACLASLLAATAHLPAEIILVHASTDRMRPRGDVRTIAAPAGALVPHLWARGYEASRSPFVAFTLGQLCVAPTWADRLLAAVTGNVAGAGGGFSVDPRAPASAWALFYLRYSAFVDANWRDGETSGEIAGDNALYSRAALDAVPSFAHTGFWEVEVHQTLRRQGYTLAGATGATATLTGAVSPRRVVAERFRHGRRFAAGRARTAVMRARIVLSAPLVPLVLWRRAARRVRTSRPDRRRLLIGTPWLLLFAGAWALGEAAGALFGAGSAS